MSQYYDIETVVAQAPACTLQSHEQVCKDPVRQLYIYYPESISSKSPPTSNTNNIIYIMDRILFHCLNDHSLQTTTLPPSPPSLPNDACQQPFPPPPSPSRR